MSGIQPNRVQIREPVSGLWVKLDTLTGRIVRIKRSPGPWRNIPVREFPAHLNSDNSPSR